MATAALVLPAMRSTVWAADPVLPGDGDPCTINGTAGDDILTGTAGDDVICGRGGNDTINGLGGEDLVRAGAGNDTVDGGLDNDRLVGGPGDDDLTGGAGNDQLLGGDGVDLLIGSDGDDVLSGGDGNDDVRGGAGVDRVAGSADDDTVNGGADDDEVLGGTGIDWLLGSTGADRLHAGPGDDTANGGDDNDDVRGGTGNDTLLGGLGDDLLQDRDGAGFVDNAVCGDGADLVRLDFFDTANADCEIRRNLDREDPVAVDDAATVVENDPATPVDVLANDTDADGGPKKVTAVTQPANGAVVITGTGSGLTYEPSPGYCNDGTPTDDFTYTLSPGGDTATVAMTVTCDDPVAVDDAASVAEDDPATTIDVLANDTGSAGVITGVTTPGNGSVTITNAGADLTYQPSADYCNDPPGTTPDTFTYTVTPGGSTATVAVTVTCVDDDPVAVDDAITITEDDTATTVDVLANDTDVDGGAISIASVDTTLTQGAVVITNGGADLTYEPVADACNNPPGTTPDTFTYTLSPGGDTATVSVTIDCVADPAVAADDAATVAEDDPATTIDVLANDTEGDTGTMSITGVSTPTNGAVFITNAGADLTYEPNDDYCNDPPGGADDTFTYTLGPDGDTATVSVTVTCVNDNPVADDESISGVDAAVGNTVLVHDDPTDAAPAEGGPKKVVTGDLLDGDTDLETPGALSITAETVSSTDGGSAVIEADGDFVFTPKAGTSCTDHSDSFDYTLEDGDGGTDTGTVTVETTGCVWYVSNNAAGDSGTSNAPFDTLAQAQTSSDVNDTIYVFDGDDSTTGYGAGITLKTNQRLLGELADLVVAGTTLATGVPGSRPTITASGADVVTLAAGNTVQGLQLDPNGAGGIDGGAGDAGGTITDVQINDTGTAGTQAGLELNGTSGTFSVSNLTVSTVGATGVRLNSAGTVSFADTGTISVTSSGAKALDLNVVNLGTSVFDTVTVTGSATGGVSATSTTGTLAFGDLALTTTSGSTAAFFLSGTAGVTVPASGTATVSATGGPAVDVLNASGAVLAFDSVSSAGSTGDGVNLDALGTGTFTAPAGTISGAAGIAFDLNGGSGDVSYAGTVANGSGASVDVSGRSGGTVTLSGSITDSNDAAGGITVSSNTGGTTVFSGTTVLDTGASHAVSMTSSDGHTMRFTAGGLLLTTSSGRAFNAENSGTVTVTGADNMINSFGGGRALSVVNTDIGADDLTFRSLSASGGGANGIVLDTTGSIGNLVVTGAGGTCTNANTTGCTGGTITNVAGADDAGTLPVGAAIALRNTVAPSFTRIRINNASNYGIRGASVTGFALANSVVHGDIGTSEVTDDSSLYFTGLTGSAAVTDTYISGGFENNMAVLNSSGSLDRITITNSTFGVSGSRPSSDALLLEADPTAGALKATITGTTFSSAAGDLFNFIHQGTAPGDLVVTSNTFDNNHPAIATGGGGLSLVTGAATTMAISSNTLRDAVGPGILIAKLAGTSTQSGTFSGNTVGASGAANSGSAEGSALKLQNVGGGTSTWAVTNNQVYGYNNFGIEVLAGGGSVAQSGAINATITGNNVAQPGTTAGTLTVPKQGVHLNVGTVPGDTFQVCAAITGNTLDASGADTNPPQGFNFDVRMRQRQSTTIRLPGYAGGNTDTAAVATFVNGNNSAGTTTTASHTVPPGGGYTGGAACTTP